MQDNEARVVISDINALDDNTLVPLILHDASDLISRLVADERTDKVKSSVKTSGNTTRSNDTQTAELERGSSGIALSAIVALLEGEAALSGIAGATTIVGTTLDVRVVVLLAEIETQIVDHVAFLHDVGALAHVALRGRLAQVLQLDYVVWMGGCAQTGENTRLGEEERAGADGHQGAFAAGVLHLDVGVRLDQAEWLGLVLQNDFGGTAWDDEDVEFGEALVGVCEGDVGAEGYALGGSDGLLVRGKGALESSALCMTKRVCQSCFSRALLPHWVMVVRKI